jgi:hypothetical protein
MQQRLPGSPRKANPLQALGAMGFSSVATFKGTILHTFWEQAWLTPHTAL